MSKCSILDAMVSCKCYFRGPIFIIKIYCFRTVMRIACYRCVYILSKLDADIKIQVFGRDDFNLEVCLFLTHGGTSGSCRVHVEKNSVMSFTGNVSWTASIQSGNSLSVVLVVLTSRFCEQTGWYQSHLTEKT